MMFAQSLAYHLQRIYSLLLKLYPRRFRDEFEVEMQAVFADLMAQAKRRGQPASLSVLLRELLYTPAALWSAYGLVRHRPRLRSALVKTKMWTNKYSFFGRAAILVLLLAAFFGPWTISSDGVPPPAWCSNPNLLLEDGRCVRLVYGTEVLAFLGAVLYAMFEWLGSGAPDFPIRAREFLFMLGLTLFVLPFFSTLLLIWSREPRRLRWLHMLALGLAAIPALALALSAPALRPGQLWGIWLYLGLAAGALVLELLELFLHGTSRS